MQANWAAARGKWKITFGAKNLSFEHLTSNRSRTHTHTQTQIIFDSFSFSCLIECSTLEKLKVRPRRQYMPPTILSLKCASHPSFIFFIFCFFFFIIILFAAIAGHRMELHSKIFCNNGNVRCPFDTVFCYQIMDLRPVFTVCKFCQLLYLLPPMATISM